MGSYKVSGYLYFTSYMSSFSNVSEFKLTFKFRPKSKFNGVGVGNGSVITVCKARCTSKPKSNLQNI